MNENKYEYSGLSRELGEIRLLELYPGSIGDALSGTLKRVRLSDRPSFEAVSYVWGSPEKTDRFICDGKPLAITKTQEEVLSRFR